MTQTPSFGEKLADILGAWATQVFRPNLQLKDLPAGEELLRASPEEQRAFVMTAVVWLQDPANHARMSWAMIESLTALLRRTLPFTHDDVLTLIGCVRRNPYRWQLEPHIGKVVATYLASNPRTPALDEALDALIADLEGRAGGADQRRRLLKLKELAGIIEVDQPLLASEPWADAARATSPPSRPRSVRCGRSCSASARPPAAPPRARNGARPRPRWSSASARRRSGRRCCAGCPWLTSRARSPSPSQRATRSTR